MDSFKALEKLYGRWLFRNKFNPLTSADDLLYDHHCGNVTLSNIQEKWIRKFINVWEKAEDYRNRYNDRIEGDQGRIFDLWNEYLANDKRSFNEYFSEEFGFTCDEGITYKQIKVLCEKLIGRKQ
tara:strand:- start:240 stop:614 length:375 start_codon:yes stop_codon:yes gene_type:complete